MSGKELDLMFRHAELEQETSRLHRSVDKYIKSKRKFKLSTEKGDLSELRNHIREQNKLPQIGDDSSALSIKNMQL